MTHTTHISTIQRYCRIAHDFRNDHTNERKTIYEITPFVLYYMIHKKNGEIVSISSAQNALTLVLKHFN